MSPIPLSDDVLEYSPVVNSVLRVVVEGHTTAGRREASAKYFKMNLLGVVLNHLSGRNDKAYYRDW